MMTAMMRIRPGMNVASHTPLVAPKAQTFLRPCHIISNGWSDQNFSLFSTSVLDARQRFLKLVSDCSSNDWIASPLVTRGYMEPPIHRVAEKQEILMTLQIRTVTRIGGLIPSVQGRSGFSARQYSINPSILTCPRLPFGSLAYSPISRSQESHGFQLEALSRAI